MTKIKKIQNEDCRVGLRPPRNDNNGDCRAALAMTIMKIAGSAYCFTFVNQGAGIRGNDIGGTSRHPTVLKNYKSKILDSCFRRNDKVRATTL
jgi:hypothetical protein